MLKHTCVRGLVSDDFCVGSLFTFCQTPRIVLDIIEASQADFYTKQMWMDRQVRFDLF